MENRGYPLKATPLLEFLGYCQSTPFQGLELPTVAVDVSGNKIRGPCASAGIAGRTVILYPTNVANPK